MLRRHRILLVEDSPADAMLLREALTEYKVPYELTVLKDGEAAVTHIYQLDGSEEPCPELVVLDLNLPKKSGYEVLQRLRSSTRCRHVPVVVLSSSDTADDRARALALGSSWYLTKPPMFDDFVKLGSVFKEILGSRA